MTPRIDLSVAFAPVSVNFGTGGVFTVNLTDPTWDCNGHNLCQWDNPDTRAITALFTLTTLPTSGLTSGSPASVPEPATLALLGVGLPVSASRGGAIGPDQLQISALTPAAPIWPVTRMDRRSHHLSDP